MFSDISLLCSTFCTHFSLVRFLSSLSSITLDASFPMLYHATTAAVQSIVGKNVNFTSLTKILHCLTQNVTCFYAKLFNNSSKMFAFAKKPFLNSPNCFNFSVFTSICPPSSVIPAVCTKYMCICLQSIYIFVILIFHT